MKVITLWQPWASLIAVGAKKYETRIWGTLYRGPLAIHASKKKPSDVLCGMDIGIIKKIGQAFGLDDSDNFKKVVAYMDTLPRGAVIATGELVGCYQIYRERGDLKIYRTHVPLPEPGAMGPDIAWYHPPETEKEFGHWAHGRFAWGIVNVEKLGEPILARGAQGLWDWSGPELTL